MTSAEFSNFSDEAFRELQRLNENCERNFRIGSWERWDYNLEEATLTFSHGGVPKLIASVLVAGTTSNSSGTWMWGWANNHLPKQVSEGVSSVKEFGEIEGQAQLTSEKLPDTENLGWMMTAVAVKVLGARGAYRCPTKTGYVYFVLTSLDFVAEGNRKPQLQNEVTCTKHGSGFNTYVCEHLIANPAQEWFSDRATEKNRWPDAWCAACNVHFLEQGEWNDKNESKIKIKLLCHFCYEMLRAQSPPAVPDA